MDPDPLVRMGTAAVQAVQTTVTLDRDRPVGDPEPHSTIQAPAVPRPLVSTTAGVRVALRPDIRLDPDIRRPAPLPLVQAVQLRLLLLNRPTIIRLVLCSSITLFQSQGCIKLKIIFSYFLSFLSLSHLNYLH